MRERTRRRIELPYVERGTGPPVVLVHASNTDHRIWTEAAELIGQHFRVVAPTQRYFGSSTWPDDGESFSVATHAEDLASFVRGLSLGEVTLVGWSYGAAVCLAMAVAKPQLAPRLILYEPAIASFVAAPDEAEAAAVDRVEMTAAARARIGQGDLLDAVRVFIDGVNDRKGTFERLPEWVQQNMLENSRTLPLLFAAPPPALTCDELGRLETTTLTVVQGDETRSFYKIAAKWASACVQGSTLVTVPKARHLMPVEDQRRFTELVLELLGSATN